MISCCIAKYLAQDEALRLKELFAAQAIESVAKQYGLSRVFGGLGYYQILVSPAEKNRAAAIFVAFEQEQRIARAAREERLLRECPICKSAEVFIKEKRNLFDKLRFMGVTARQCSVCDTRWYT